MRQEKKRKILMKINKDKLKKLMYLQGLTQKALAKKLNTSVGTVYSYAQGIKTPRPERAAEIAKILKCNISDFID